jgi:hypothetical protein
VTYFQISNKLALLKKKRLMVHDDSIKINQKYLQVIPRGLTLKEVTKAGQCLEKHLIPVKS